jgi:hypothetical protein
LTELHGVEKSDDWQKNLVQVCTIWHKILNDIFFSDTYEKRLKQSNHRKSLKKLEIVLVNQLFQPSGHADRTSKPVLPSQQGT